MRKWRRKYDGHYAIGHSAMDPRFVKVAHKDTAEHMLVRAKSGHTSELGYKSANRHIKRQSLELGMLTGCVAISYSVGSTHKIPSSTTRQHPHASTYVLLHWRPGITVVLLVYPLICVADVYASYFTSPRQVVGLGLHDVLHRLETSGIYDGSKVEEYVAKRSGLNNGPPILDQKVEEKVDQ